MPASSEAIESPPTTNFAEFAQRADYSLLEALHPDPQATGDGDDHQPRQVFSGHYVPVTPTPIPAPEYVAHSSTLFNDLGLSDELAHDDGGQVRWPHAVLWASCLVGFVGVMVVNFNQTLLDFHFTLLGEGFVVIAAFILSAGSIYGKKVSQSMDSIILTGYQLAIGGLVLVLGGYLTGGELTGFTLKSSALLLYLALLSSVAFALWATLLKYNRVGLVAVFNFLIPVFGAILSAAFLGERILEWKNLAALLLVCTGIWLVTKEN